MSAIRRVISLRATGLVGEISGCRLGLVVFLLVTVALLGVTVVSGLRAVRRVHIPFVVLTLISLGITIFFAEKLGEQYDLSTGGWVTTLHLFFAKVTTLAFLAPVITGWRTLKHAETRPLHRKIVAILLVLVIQQETHVSVKDQPTYVLPQIPANYPLKASSAENEAGKSAQ